MVMQCNEVAIISRVTNCSETFDNDFLENNLENNAWNLEHNAEKLYYWKFCKKYEH